jgi:hypothetical protein
MNQNAMKSQIPGHYWEAGLASALLRPHPDCTAGVPIGGWGDDR